MAMYCFILLADSIRNSSARARGTANVHSLSAKLRNELAMQCGGVPGLGIELPVIAVTMLQELCKTRRESIGLLLVDAT